MKRLGLPPYLSANAFLEVCNSLLDRQSYQKLVQEINSCEQMANDKI